MAILLNDNLNVAAAKPVDHRYGPYADTAAALAAIPSYQRYEGLSVGVIESGNVVEYWFASGITNGDLEVKLPSNSDGRTVVAVSSILQSNKYYLVDSSAATITVALPASPFQGDFIWLQDAKGTWGTNNITVNNNGSNIVGLNDSLSLDVSDALVILTYIGGTTGWDVKELAGDFTEGATGAGSGEPGATGATGATGAVGPSGSDGLSAYQIAVNQGFAGSEYDWLHTLPTPLKEQVSVSAAAVDAPFSSPYNINIKNNQAYLFLSGFNQDFSLNFRGDSSTSLNGLLAVGEAITCSLTVVNTSTARKLTHIFIDGTEVAQSYWYLGNDPAAYETGVYAVYMVKTGNNQFFVTVNQAPLQPVVV